jgi:hypothetical protein
LAREKKDANLQLSEGGSVIIAVDDLPLKGDVSPMTGEFPSEIFFRLEGNRICII